MNYSNSQRAGVILYFTALLFGAYGTTISGDFFAENTDVFMKEITEAIRLVASSELDEVQKKEVQSILEEAKESVQENSKEKALSTEAYQDLNINTLFKE